jgi:hypothetical protein
MASARRPLTASTSISNSGPFFSSFKTPTFNTITSPRPHFGHPFLRFSAGSQAGGDLLVARPRCSQSAALWLVFSGCSKSAGCPPSGTRC